MTQPMILRVILGDEDARKIILPAGRPDSIEELIQTLKLHFGLGQDFRLQYQDADFGMEFVNLSVIAEIDNKATLKVVYLQNSSAEDSILLQLLPVEPLDASSVSSVETDNTEPASSTSSSPSARHWSWPSVFTIPRFSYESHLQLEKADAEYSAKGSHLNVPPKLKSNILECLAEEILKYKAYPTDMDLNDVAEALIKKHPCLREQGSFNGCYGWKLSLRFKMANYRSKLRGIGCSEVTINSLTNKEHDKRSAASNVKKPRRAEVNYLPQHPTGETTESLEKERVALLSENKKRNNDHIVTLKMEKTFSYRRQEILEGEPLVTDVKSRWPALFKAKEIEKEFHRISTVPLISTFFAALDRYTPRLMELFQGKGGAQGRRLRHVIVDISKDDTIEAKRACVLKSLCIYLNEDPDKLFKVYMDTDTEVGACKAETVLGIYAIKKEGAAPGDELEDVGILIEGEEVISDLGNIGMAFALLFGLIYCLNLTYPADLRCTFEVSQKILLNLDGQRLSSKAQFLKNKLMG